MHLVRSVASRYRSRPPQVSHRPQFGCGTCLEISCGNKVGRDKTEPGASACEALRCRRPGLAPRPPSQHSLGAGQYWGVQACVRAAAPYNGPREAQLNLV